MNKFLSMLIALVMLVMPTLGMADADAMVQEAIEAGRRAESTMTISLSGLPFDESVKPIVDDVMDALQLVFFTQEGDAGENGFSIRLSGKDVLTGACTTEDDMLYVSCNLLGSKAIAIAPQDLPVLFNRGLDLAVLMGSMEEEEAANIKEMFTQFLANMETDEYLLDDDMDDLLDMDSDVEDYDVSGLMTVIEALAYRMEASAVTMQPKNCDPAVGKIHFVVTGEDLVALGDGLMTLLESIPEVASLVALVEPFLGITMSDIHTGVTALLQQTADMIPDGIVYDIYMDENDDIVCWTMHADIVEPGSVPAVENVVSGVIGEAATPVPQTEAEQKGNVLGTVDLVYTRLTGNDNVAHSVTYMIQSEDNSLSVTFDMVEKATGFVLGYGVAMDGQTILGFELTANSQETENCVHDSIIYRMEDRSGDEPTNVHMTADIVSEKMGEDVHQTTTVKSGLEDVDMVTVNVTTQTMAPFATVDTANALRLAELSDEEFQAWFINDVVGGLQTWMVEAMQALPTSVLMLMMGDTDM